MQDCAGMAAIRFFCRFPKEGMLSFLLETKWCGDETKKGTCNKAPWR